MDLEGIIVAMFFLGLFLGIMIEKIRWRRWMQLKFKTMDELIAELEKQKREREDGEKT